MGRVGAERGSNEHKQWSFTRTVPHRVGRRISKGETVNITNSSKLSNDEAGQTSSHLADTEGQSMQFESAQLCMGQGSSNIGERAMLKHQKQVLADLLRTWRKYFGDNWFTAELAVKCLWTPADRDLLRQFGIETGNGDELNRRLDNVRNKVVYNFVVKRNLPYMQTVEWRVLLQDNRVDITDEERSDFIAVRKDAAMKIDPMTAEVTCSRGDPRDPYGFCGDDLESLTMKWLLFARAPESDIWVSFRDLPKDTREILEQRPNESIAGQG
jgi:hypothetical protein